MDSALFKLKQKTAGETGVNGTKDVKIIILLKYLSNFWRTFVKPLINCEINLVLTWSVSVFIITGVADGQVQAFAITDIKLYVPVVTLLTHDNPKLLQQLKPGFKRTINWNKYQSKASIQALNQYLDYLIDLSFQEANRLLFYHLNIMHTKKVTSNIFFRL